MALQDSGARKEFHTGAARDIHDGKGRCDLLPLDVIMHLVPCVDRAGTVTSYIADFMASGDTEHLYSALRAFMKVRYSDNSTALLALSMHYEDGAAKYSDNNWKKDIPLHCYIDSAIRHYLKDLRGDIDEPHGRAFMWNLVGAIWTVKNRPDMIDIEFESSAEQRWEGARMRFPECARCDCNDCEFDYAKAVGAEGNVGSVLCRNIVNSTCEQCCKRGGATPERGACPNYEPQNTSV